MSSKKQKKGRGSLHKIEETEIKGGIALNDLHLELSQNLDDTTEVTETSGSQQDSTESPSAPQRETPPPPLNKPQTPQPEPSQPSSISLDKIGNLETLDNLDSSIVQAQEINHASTQDLSLDLSVIPVEADISQFNLEALMPKNSKSFQFHKFLFQEEPFRDPLEFLKKYFRCSKWRYNRTALVNLTFTVFAFLGGCLASGKPESAVWRAGIALNVILTLLLVFGVKKSSQCFGYLEVGFNTSGSPEAKMELMDLVWERSLDLKKLDFLALLSLLVITGGLGTLRVVEHVRGKHWLIISGVVQVVWVVFIVNYIWMVLDVLSIILMHGTVQSAITTLKEDISLVIGGVDANTSNISESIEN